MSEDTNDSDKAKIIKTALEPAAMEFREAARGTGQALGEAALMGARGVRALVSLVYPLVWTVDKISEYFEPELDKKLAAVPEERRIAPNLAIAGPVYEAVRFLGQEPVLRNLFANLLITAMDKETARSAHPAFVEIIKQMSPDEARILKYMSDNSIQPFINIHKLRKNVSGYVAAYRNLSLLATLAKCEHPEFTQTYIDNLCRLEVCEAPIGIFIENEDAYEELENHDTVKILVDEIDSEGPDVSAKIERRSLWITNLGRHFINACVDAKPEGG